MDLNRSSQNLQCTVESEVTEWEGKKKSKRPRTDDNEAREFLDMGEKECELRPTTDDSEAQEFFALMERIHAMKKLFKQKQMNRFSAEEISTAQDIGGNAIKCLSLLKPSFKWEDFSILTKEDSLSAQRKSTSCTNNNAGSSDKSLKADMGSDKYKRVATFDLNVEATSEHPAPAAAISLFP